MITAGMAALIIFGLYLTSVKNPQRHLGHEPTLAELAMLEASMKAYKERHGAFPPCMGADLPADRQARFTEHLRKAYPHYKRGSYATVRQLISAGEPTYSFRDAAGQTRRLDLDTLDQAEALVFWLGGFPAPVDAERQPPNAMKVIGFNADPQNPFGFGRQPGESRAEFVQKAEISFDFDESRLTDRDDDGWLEYVAWVSADQKTADVPPYVYFDARLYAARKSAALPGPYSGYPITNALGGNARPAELRDRWGLAVPYATSAPGGSESLQWINPLGIQIIAAGDDLRYCSRQNATQLRIPTYPSGATYYRNDEFEHPSNDYDPDERDNLTNFSPGELEDQRPRP